MNEMNDHPEQASADDAGGAKPAVDPGEGVEGTSRAAIADVETTLARHLDEIEDLVREHPLATIVVAAGLGLAAGLILTRR